MARSIQSPWERHELAATGAITDGLPFDTVRVRLIEIGEAVAALDQR